MKRILITHTDLDGSGCSIIFKKHYPDIEVQYHNYDTIDDISQELLDNKNNYDKIYFADITPSENIGKEMLKDHDKFIFIDHHITREYLIGKPFYDTSVCATVLTAAYFYPMDNVYRDFIHAVDAYDSWKLNSPYRDLGLNLNLLFDYYKMDEFVKEFSDMRDININEEIIIEVLKKIERDYLSEKLTQGKIKIDKYSNSYFEVYVTEKGGHLGLLVDDPRFPPECKYIKVININDKVVGLYSNGFNVSEIAKVHGGGGHTNAAGYQINDQKLYIG